MTVPLGKHSDYQRTLEVAVTIFNEIMHQS